MNRLPALEQSVSFLRSSKWSSHSRHLGDAADIEDGKQKAAKKIAAVIFPVDAERETGFRRYNNTEMLEIAAENSDVLIPFVSIDPHKGKLGVREASG